MGALGFAGCGGATKTVTTGVTRVLPPGVKLYSPPHVAAATYSISLVGTKGPGRAPAGEPNGSALAVISINPSTNELCWKFSQLKNVTAPTDARLYVYTPGGPGTNGARLGSGFSASGCIPLPPITLELIERRPQLYIISIHTARFPGGAVRGAI
jgi:hypothetical protein